MCLERLLIKWKTTVSSWQRKEAEAIMETDYTNHIVLLANTAAQAETLLHSLEWAAAGIGFHVKADKMEYTCFNQRGNISTLNGSSLKLVEAVSHQPKQI